MFGNIINNDQLLRLIRQSNIKIEPFEKVELKTIHYPLRASVLYEKYGTNHKGEPQLKRVHTFDDDPTYEVPASAYLVAEIEQFLWVAPGLVGHFVASSNLIEQGFTLTAGRLEHPFGEFDGKRQRVRFGLKNQLDVANPLKASDKLAYVYFIDLRGLNNLDIRLSDEELRILAHRVARFSRAADDGPFYPNE